MTMNEAGARTCGGARATRATSAAFVGAPRAIDNDRVQGAAAGDAGRCRGWTSAKLPARAVALPTRATAHERRRGISDQVVAAGGNVRTSTERRARFRSGPGSNLLP